MKTKKKTEVSGWNGKLFPDKAMRLTLPSGKVLEDAIIWPEFCQEELGINPDDIWNELMVIPEWPSSHFIPFREDGSDPHWIKGDHPFLRYRGNELKRNKIWCQSEYDDGLKRYGYTGWQWGISYAKHDVEFIPSVKQLADRLNAGLVRSGHKPHNDWIITKYEDEDHEIGYHSDKDKDFAENSYFIVIKFGATRNFAFRLPGEKDPFFIAGLEAGTAVFVRAKADGAANDIVQHGVPRSSAPVGISGSIVSRCIETTIPWDAVAREVNKRWKIVK